MKISLYLLIMLFILSALSMKNIKNHKNIYKYQILKAGEIQPKGWILEQLKKDLTIGYIGSYDKVNSTVTHKVFVKQNRLSTKNIKIIKKWWNGEHEAYWKDAVIRMAFLTKNEAYISVAKEWVYEIIKNIDQTGYIGIYKNCNKPNCRFNHTKGNGELWTTSRILMALIAYYEFTNDKTAFDAIKNAINLIIENYSIKNYFSIPSNGGGISHGIAIFENLEWLYRNTGDQKYLNFSKKLYTDFNKSNVRDNDLQIKYLIDKKRLFDKHGAHIAEGIFIPQFIASIEGDKKLQQCADNAIVKLEKHLTPGGAMRSAEWIKERKGTADEKYEYCSIAEMINPLNIIFSLTGDIDIADKIENMTFNAAQGARLPVLKALSYLTSDNRIKINHYAIGRRETYDASHIAANCCALNGARLMPYYVTGMWMKNLEKNGLEAVLFGPCELTTTLNEIPVQIIEHTNYPFSDKITFTINPETKLEFPLIIRKPHGCSKTLVEIPTTGELEETDNQIIINNKWAKGDEVNILFSFKTIKINQPKSKSVKKQGVYLKRGPLVYALPFKHNIETIKEYNKSGFYRYKITATDTSLWHKYKIDTNETFKFFIKPDADFNTPWNNSVVYLKGRLINTGNNKKDVMLVPMGNTIFRRVTFSVANYLK